MGRPLARHALPWLCVLVLTCRAAGWAGDDTSPPPEENGHRASIFAASPPDDRQRLPAPVEPPSFWISGATAGISSGAASPHQTGDGKVQGDVSAPARSDPQPDPCERADLELVRLAPSAFPELPAPIRADLERRRCTIPQLSRVFSFDRLGNVIHGDFGKGPATDWAVLCSVDRVSAILVYWDGDPESVEEIEKGPDVGGFQVMERDQCEFSWYIAASGRDRDTFLETWSAFGGPEPPAIDHQGIGDGWAEKGSIILYWHEGAWIRLTGDD